VAIWVNAVDSSSPLDTALGRMGMLFILPTIGLALWDVMLAEII
jgi:hypothetical protein